MAMPKVIVREIQPKGMSPEEVKIHHDFGIKILARWIAQAEKENKTLKNKAGNS